jgi:hypothetical protein
MKNLNKFEEKKNFYPSEKVIIKEETNEKKLISENNYFYKNNYKLNYISSIIYFATFIISYEFILRDNNIFTLTLGWSMFGISTLCNDGLEDNFSSDSVLNNLLKNWMMDFMGISSLSFKNMRLRYYLKVKKGEIYDITSEWLLDEWKKVIEETYNDDLKKYIIRLPFYLIISRLRLYQIIIIYSSFIFLWIKLISISHNSKNVVKEVNSKKENLVFDGTWDIFPKSYVFNILTGNLNLNASHLNNQTKTRADLIKISKENRNKRYRTIDNLSEYWKLCTDKISKNKLE